MHRWLRIPRGYTVLLKIFLVLIVVDWAVRGPFFADYILTRYARPYVLLRDRTGAEHPNVLFDIMDQLPRRDPKVVFVGDSTMNPAEGSEKKVIPYLVGAELRESSHRSDVQVIDASEIGLYAADALLFIDKAFGSGADVIVYGIVPRAFPKHPETAWVSRISDMMSAGDIWRLYAVGGGGWVARNLPPEEILAGIVSSTWSTYAYRASLRLFLWDKAVEPAFPKLGDLSKLLAPRAVQREVPTAPHAPIRGPYEWTFAKYGYPNKNWRALELIGRLCRRYAPGRCVVYAGPINPLRRDRLLQPGLYPDYLARLRVVAGRYGLIWRDYTDVLAAGDFRVPKYGGLRDPVHPNEIGRAKLAKLLVEPVSEALRKIPREGRD